MPRFGGRFTVGTPPTVPREPGEETLFQGQVTEIEGNHSGTLSLTDRRVLYEPQRAGTRPMSVPLTELSILQLNKPPFGNLRVLKIGHEHHVRTFWVSNGETLVDRIRQARASVRHPSMEAPILPLPTDTSSGVGPLQAGMPPCPTCGTLYVRRPDGTMVCPRCGPPRSSLGP